MHPSFQAIPPSFSTFRRQHHHFRATPRVPSCSRRPRRPSPILLRQAPPSAIQTRLAAMLQEELARIKADMAEISLEQSSSWPTFLRGCAQMRWGAPEAALVEFRRLLNRGSGLEWVPELHHWMGQAALLAGEVGYAWESFELAYGHQLDALGNELHFAHRFEDGFRPDVPRPRAPPWSLQRAVAAYAMRDHPKARLAAAACAMVAEEPLWEHALCWFLASGRKGAVMRDADEHMAGAKAKLVERRWLDQVLPLYFKEIEVEQVEKSWAVSKQESSPTSNDVFYTAFYLGLYYDAFVGDEERRDAWFATCEQLERNEEADLSDDDPDADMRRFLTRLAELKIGTEFPTRVSPAIWNTE